MKTVSRTSFFISSPYVTFKDFRRELANKLFEIGHKAWLAEGTKFHVAGIPSVKDNKEDISISDICLDALSNCNAVICVLGDNLGSPIKKEKLYLQAKHFELELFSALTQNIPILILYFEAFNPLSESKEFVEALSRSRVIFKQVTNREVALDLATRFADEIHSKALHSENQISPFEASRSFITGLAKNRMTLETNHRFPFWGKDEDHITGINISLAKSLISESETETNNHIRFGRLWMALQEIKGQTFEESCQQDSAEVWDTLLSNWRAVSSFYGVHGHLYTGALAASTGLATIRAATRIGPLPFNFIMSAKFSIVKEFRPFGFRTKAFLQLYNYIRSNKAISDDLADSHIIMGAIQFRLFNLPMAHYHFRKALKSYEKTGNTYQIAYAQLHVAQTKALFFPTRKEAIKLAKEAMGTLMDEGHTGQQKRHLQKTAKILNWAGDRDFATHYLNLANNLENSETYLDQNKI